MTTSGIGAIGMSGVTAAGYQPARPPQGATPTPEASADKPPNGRAGPSPLELNAQEEKVVRALERRDREVRQHERAHAVAGGPHSGMPSYDTQRGPDGKSYAIGGETPIDVAPEKDPEATVRKMDQIIRAALAPAQPSSQDRAIAAQARAQKAEAQAEIRAAEAEALRNGESPAQAEEAVSKGYDAGGRSSGPRGGGDPRALIGATLNVEA